MKHLASRTSIVAATLLIAVACGGNTPASSTSPSTRPSASSAATSPAGTVPPTGPAVPTASPAVTIAPPTTAPATTPPTGPTAAPIFSSHGDPALEALLPSTVSGVALTRYSLTLTQLLDQGGDRASIDAFLVTLGKTEADGSWAAAFDLAGGLGGGINAYKVAGADAAMLLGGITALEQSELGMQAGITNANVGGKDVTVVSLGNGVNDTVWIYGYGDVIFVVHAGDAKHAADFLAALP